MSASVSMTWLLKASGVSGTTSSLTFSLRAAELVGHFGVGHGHPAGDGVAQLLDEQRFAQVVFELLRRHRRIVELQHLPVARFADELAVLLEGGDGEDARANLFVADRHALAPRFGDHRLLVNELLQDLLLDAQLPQELFAHLRAVGVAIRLELRRVAALKLADRDFASFDFRQDVTRRRAGTREVGNEEDHKSQDDERQAPFEPAAVAPHPVEHRHSVGS